MCRQRDQFAPIKDLSCVRVQESTLTPQIIHPHLMRVDPDGHPEGARQTEVGDFDHAVPVDQKILGFQIPVQNPPLVAEQDPLRRRRAGGGGVHAVNALSDTHFPGQFRRQCMHFGNSAGNFGGSAAGRA